MQIKSFKLFGLTLVVAIAAFLSGCGAPGASEDETKTWSATKLYAQAKEEQENGNYDEAVRLFEKLGSRFPFGVYAQQAQIEIAYSQYKVSDPEHQAQALSTIERFIKLYPKHSHLDYLLYLRGLVTFNDNLGFLNVLANQDLTERDPKAARDSFDAFKQLVVQFPDSKYTPDAILRMKYLTNSLAQYDVHVAKYYLRRGAYLASANRAQSAITEYPDAPVIEEALFILVRSYDAMGMNDLRDDANRVFLKNFPNSAYLNGKGLDKNSWWKFWK